MKDKSLQPYIWILLSGFSFSWMVILAPLANKACPWQFVAIMRCIIPLVLTAIWAKWDGVEFVVWSSRVLWVRSIAGSCSLVGTFYALSILPVTDIYTISNIFPIWVALLSWPLLGRMPSIAVWVSIVSSVVGVAVIQGHELGTGNYAALVVVAVSLFTAVAMLGLNRLRHMDPRAVVVHFSATALVFACGTLLFPIEPPTVEFSAIHAWELLGVGVSAAIGQYFLTRAFTAGDPARVSVASLSQFVMVLALDVTILGHVPSLSKLWGIPLILGPTIWLMTRCTRSEPEPPVPIPAASLR
ncbi:MAG: DMT family transporter [Gemmataceae bacterium]|nr:DMT family transporter [Gemmataceae bacterium]